jgi:hypothetical protein
MPEETKEEDDIDEEESTNYDPAVKHLDSIVFWVVVFIGCVAGLIVGFEPVSPWILVLGCIVSAIALFFLITGYSLFSTKNAKKK